MRPGDDSQVTVLREEEILSLRVVIGANTSMPAGRIAPAAEDADSERKVLEDHITKLKAEQHDLEQKLRGMNRTDSTSAEDDAPESPEPSGR
jgi:hypothetical protein